MKYHILNERGDRIASFVTNNDRDICLDAFEEVFPDCVFDTCTEEDEQE